MSEWICRALRDGGLEGEHAPALTVSDTRTTPLGSAVFDHVLTQLSSFISSRKASSKGIVLLAFSRSPLYYEQLLKSKGYDVVSANAWFRVLDCYTDPLGWKKKLVEIGSVEDHCTKSLIKALLCRDVKDLDEVLSSIFDLAKELCGDEKGSVVVAIDSVSEMLRHATLPSLVALLSNLRSHGIVSSIFWTLHKDLHDSRSTAALEYISSMKASIEPMVQPRDEPKANSVDLTLMEQNLRRGKFCVRVKRRNGRVREMFEEVKVENSGIKFLALSSEDETINQSLVPKVQFNLQLSEKERNDRANVVLPFEHQGNGKPIEIYDGRKSQNAEKTMGSGKGEIIYFRDSDDEMPDSDEDPDDDLEI